jgi:hypothetical protein
MSLKNKYDPIVQIGLELEYTILWRLTKYKLELEYIIYFILYKKGKNGV